MSLDLDFGNMTIGGPLVEEPLEVFHMHIRKITPVGDARVAFVSGDGKMHVIKIMPDSLQFERNCFLKSCAAVTGLCSVGPTDVHVGFADGQVHVYNLETKKRKTLLLEPHDAMLAVPGGLALARGAQIHVWDQPRNMTKFIHGSMVRAFAALPCGNLVSGDEQGAIVLWDQTGMVLAQLVGHTQPVSCLTCVGDCFLVSGSHDGTLRFWNLATSECLWVLEAHAGDQVTAVCAVQERFVASGSNNGQVRLWDLQTGNCVQTLSYNQAAVRTLFTLGNKMLVCGAEDGLAHVYQFKFFS